jgi:SAM-dependent methyltransferase
LNTCADAASIPLTDGVFDYMVCYSTFPHFRNKVKAPAEMKRVIRRRGGLLIYHTSSRAKVNELHRRIPEVENDITPEAAEMQRMLSAAGFTGIKIEDEKESYLCAATRA